MKTRFCGREKTRFLWYSHHIPENSTKFKNKY